MMEERLLKDVQAQVNKVGQWAVDLTRNKDFRKKAARITYATAAGLILTAVPLAWLGYGAVSKTFVVLGGLSLAGKGIERSLFRESEE